MAVALIIAALVLGGPVILFFVWTLTKPPGYLAGDDENGEQR